MLLSSNIYEGFPEGHVGYCTITAKTSANTLIVINIIATKKLYFTKEWIKQMTVETHKALGVNKNSVELTWEGAILKVAGFQPNGGQGAPWNSQNR